MKFLLSGILFFTIFFNTRNKCFGQAPLIYKDSLVTRFFQKEQGCIAGDGGFSIPLSNNKVLWLMGDSHIDDYDTKTRTVPCLFQVRNTALLQPLNNWKSKQTRTLTGTQSGLKSYLKNNPNDTFFCWPGAGIQLKDTVYIYCSSFKNQGSGAFGFASAGNDFIAKVSIEDMKVKSFHPLPGFNGISFGICFIKDEKTDWVYVYGQKYTSAEIRCDLYLARFSAKQPDTAWQYWDGSTWTNDVMTAASIAMQTGVSGTFQVSKVRGKMLLLSSALSINCDSGTEMYTAFSDNLTGPFSGKKLFYAIDDRLKGHSPFFYSAIAHPEYINNKDELLITYAINGYGTCVQDCVDDRMNPDVYQLKGIRVPCKLLF